MTEQNRKGIISFTITDRGALYSSFISFVTNGGLFVPTQRTYELGDEVLMLLKIMNDPSVTPVAGRVAWVTPAGAQGRKEQGVGIQFIDRDNGATRTSIEEHLAAKLNDERSTHTM